MKKTYKSQVRFNSQSCITGYEAYLSKFFANQNFTSATRFFLLNQPIIGPLWREKFWLVILSGASLYVPRVKNRQKTDFWTFRNINSIFSKTVKDRKMNDPNFFQNRMVNQRVWLIIALGVEFTLIKRLKVEISEKNRVREVLRT